MKTFHFQKAVHLKALLGDKPLFISLINSRYGVSDGFPSAERERTTTHSRTDENTKYEHDASCIWLEGLS